jgi:MFS family permease
VDKEGDVTGAEETSFGELLGNPALLSIFAISFIGAIGSNAVPAALPAISSAFGIGSGRIGLVLTLFYLPLILLNPVIGVVSDMYGRRKVVIPALLLFAVSGLATLAVDQFHVLLGLRVFQAVCFAGTLPLTATLVGDLYDGVNGSTAQGLRSSVNGIANTVAPVLAGLLAVLNWRYPFLLFTLAFPILGLFYLYYPEPITPSADGDTLSELRTELATYWNVVQEEVTDHTLGTILLGGFTLFFLKQGMKAYVPVFVVQVLGGTTSTAGIVLGVYGATRVVIAPLAGPLSKRTGRKYGLIGALLVLGFATAAIPFSSSLVNLSIIVSLFAIGEAIVNPVLKSSVADLADDDNRGGLMGCLSMLGATANTMSPAIVGFIVVVSGFETAFLLPSILCFVYAGFIFLLVERSRIDSVRTIA